MVLVSAATRLRHRFGAGCGACPTSAASVSGLLPVSFVLTLRVSFFSLSAFCLFYLWSYSVPAYWVPLGGLCIADTRRDECLGIPCSLPRPSRTLWFS